jgi:phenylalanyl-tRNA synthetase beta chain
VFYAELNWDWLSRTALSRKISSTPLPRYPWVRRDLALLVPSGVGYVEIEELIRKVGSRLIVEVDLFDVYEGKNLPPQTVSYAIKVILQSENKTLTDKEVDKTMMRILNNLKSELGIELRS